MSFRRTTLVAGLLFCFTVFTAGSTTAATIDVTVGPGGSPTFSPQDVTIQIGDTVRWTWASDGHNVGSGLPGSPTSAFFSGPPQNTGTVFSVTFDAAFLAANPIANNLYDYHCHPHGFLGMVGSIQVASPTIPSSSEWSILLLAVLMLGTATWFLRKI